MAWKRHQPLFTSASSTDCWSARTGRLRPRRVHFQIGASSSLRSDDLSNSMFHGEQRISQWLTGTQGSKGSSSWAKRFQIYFQKRTATDASVRPRKSSSEDTTIHGDFPLILSNWMENRLSLSLARELGCGQDGRVFLLHGPNQLVISPISELDSNALTNCLTQIVVKVQRMRAAMGNGPR